MGCGMRPRIHAHAGARRAARLERPQKKQFVQRGGNCFAAAPQGTAASAAAGGAPPEAADEAAGKKKRARRGRLFAFRSCCQAAAQRRNSGAGGCARRIPPRRASGGVCLFTSESAVGSSGLNGGFCAHQTRLAVRPLAHGVGCVLEQPHHLVLREGAARISGSEPPAGAGQYPALGKPSGLAGDKARGGTAKAPGSSGALMLRLRCRIRVPPRIGFCSFALRATRGAACAGRQRRKRRRQLLTRLPATQLPTPAAPMQKLFSPTGRLSAGAGGGGWLHDKPQCWGEPRLITRPARPLQTASGGGTSRVKFVGFCDKKEKTRKPSLHRATTLDPPFTASRVWGLSLPASQPASQPGAWSCRAPSSWRGGSSGAAVCRASAGTPAHYRGPIESLSRVKPQWPLALPATGAPPLRAATSRRTSHHGGL